MRSYHSRILKGIPVRHSQTSIHILPARSGTINYEQYDLLAHKHVFKTTTSFRPIREHKTGKMRPNRRKRNFLKLEILLFADILLRVLCVASCWLDSMRLYTRASTRLDSTRVESINKESNLRCRAIDRLAVWCWSGRSDLAWPGLEQKRQQWQKAPDPGHSQSQKRSTRRLFSENSLLARDRERQPNRK